MNNVYEISVWDDVYNSTQDRYDEQKIVVIGTNTMVSQSRAREPKLTTKLDGTNVFSFDMYDRYIDNITGEEVVNPYIKYLVNERKIKVKWKDKWYDFLIKTIKEDSANRLYSYTCEDAYITELSRTGFSLEFATELQNNIGTAQELIEQTLEGTDWQFSPGDDIYQTTQESVYETTLLTSVSAYKDPTNTAYTIPSGSNILLFYSNVSDEDALPSTCSFYYTNEGSWERGDSNMVVTNGDCYHVEGVTWTITTSGTTKTATATKNGAAFVRVVLTNGLSQNYIAEHYINSIKAIYSKTLERYVYVYTRNNTQMLGYQTTVFDSPLAVVNVVTNPNNYSSTEGWLGTDLGFELYPPFTSNTDLSTYSSKNYLKATRTATQNNYICNTGIPSNKPFIPNGFTVGENYIFRLKAENDSHTTITSVGTFTPVIATRNLSADSYIPVTTYFNVTSSAYINGYLEYVMTCTKSCSVEDLSGSSTNVLGIFIRINSNGTYWFEDVQFFKEIYGLDGSTTRRINPGEMDMQAVSQTVWKYYLASKESEGYTKDTLEYDYISLSEWDEVTPVYNAFAKAGTIKESQSNRFNILQSIAETFQCWVRFIIEHENDGSISRDSNGRLKKYVTLRTEIGEETGINFVYGIDLEGVTRNLKSSNIATKTIVLQNENEFGKNGFCSIARSSQNYTKENFIYNFDYYISQGLLDQDQLNYDLYNSTDGYYYVLNKLNTQYDEASDLILNKINEETRQLAAQEIYKQYVTASEKQLAITENSIMKLAGVDSMSAAESYLNTHANNTKVKSLLKTRSQVLATKAKYQEALTKITASVEALSSSIDDLQETQEGIITQLEAAHEAFETKYARFIQEGTWNSEDYWDDTEYYLDAVQVAYKSSRPQLDYDVKVLRLSDFEDFSSKVFDLGDICTVQDVKYFGYLSDGITPYKEQVYISEMTSYFDTPDKDSFKVQNYKTNFDDLFHRITAATQSLTFSEGKYARAAGALNSNGTIKYSVLQATFDHNRDLVMGALNESVLIDNRGITVSSNNDGSSLVRITSGGIFVTNDGGVTWKNAVRGDGISADVLVAGSINTEQISIFGTDTPSFVWDENGINAYVIKFDDELDRSFADLNQFVRFDKYGIYGIQGNDDFVPEDEDDIYENEGAFFGLTWNRFFLKNQFGTGSVEISSDNHILIRDGDYDRIKIGYLFEEGADGEEDYEDYGIVIRDGENNKVLVADSTGLTITGEIRATSGYISDDVLIGSSASNISLADLTSVATEAIGSVDVMYAQNQSSSTAPISGWSTTAPEWREGYYIWQKTITYYVDHTEENPHFIESTPVCLTGAAGASGYNSATIYLYQRSSVAPAGPSTASTYTFSTATLSPIPTGWSTTIPSGSQPCYVIANSAVSTSDTVSLAGNSWSAPVILAENGESGLNQATIFLYQRAASEPTMPTGNLVYTFSTGEITGTLGNWSQSVPTTDGNPCYMISAVAINSGESDTIASSEWVGPVVLVEDGLGYSFIQEIYLLTSAASGVTAPTTLPITTVTDTTETWTLTCPTWVSGKYYWTCSQIERTDGTWFCTPPQLANGLKSANTAAVKGVPCYYRSSTNSTPTISTSTTIGTSDNTNDVWTYVMPRPKRDCYFYTCEEYTDGNGNRTFSDVRWIPNATYASKWCSASDATYIDGGAIYANSVTADQIATNTLTANLFTTTLQNNLASSNTYEEYCLSDSSSSVGSNPSWSATFPTWTSGKYIWVRKVTNTKDINGGVTSTYEPNVNGYYNASLTDACSRAAAALVDVDIQYIQTQSNTTVPSQSDSGWSTTAPSWQEGYYIWQRTVTTTASGIEYTAPTCISGRDGNDGTVYRLIIPWGTVTKNSDGTYDPTTITLYSRTVSGSSSAEAYAGRFKIETTTDNSSWSQRYLSSTNETSTTYTIPTNIISMRCSLYGAGGTTTLLDQQIVPIITDGTSGEDGYTIVLSNENHTFAGSTSAALAASTSCAVIGYKGATQMATTIGTISGIPTGMSVSISNNGTTTTWFTVSVTTDMTTQNGMLTVPVTIDGKTFEKKFTYSLALKGETGEDGIGISSVIEQYYLSSSSSTQTGGSWSTTCPSYVEGYYYWTRSQITWTDNNVTYTDPVLAQGLTSANSNAASANDKADSALYNGRNFMVNTLEPNVSSTALYPRIINQPVDTSIYPYSTTTSTTGIISTAEHGVRVTSQSASITQMYIRFGSTSTSTGTLNGLTAGSTYTLSFDTTYYLPAGTFYIYFYTASSTASSYSQTQTAAIATVSSRAVATKSFSFTFTIPTTAAKCYFSLWHSKSSSASFQSGDYIELRNIMLERGSEASDYTPAPEDAEYRSQTIYIQAVNQTTSMDSTTTWITATGESTTSNATGLTPSWTTKRPTYRQNYPVLFVATQRQTVAQSMVGACICTTPLIDDTTTVIDGGKIITGSITANQIAAGAITAGNIKLYGKMNVYQDSTLGTTGGYLGYMSGSTYNDSGNLVTTNGMAIMSPTNGSTNGYAYLIVTDSGVRASVFPTGDSGGEYKAYISGAGVVTNTQITAPQLKLFDNSSTAILTCEILSRLIDVKFRIYNSVTDIGLATGNTVKAVFDYMPTYSILIVQADDFNSNYVPNTLGTVLIVKPASAARSWIQFFGKTSTQSDYRMYLDSDNEPTGTWVAIGSSGSSNTVPTNHASSETTYGVGSSSLYGHVKLTDTVSSSYGNSNGWAATPYAVSTRAPTSHASTATTYGVGNNTNYGHVKLVSSMSSDSDTYGNSGGYAITPYGLYAAISDHNHSASNITSGTLPITRGGTGATTAAAARAALGISNADYTFYDSVTDLSLTAGSATISTAFSAMSTSSVLIATAANFSSSAVPSTLGTVIIVKSTDASRSWIQFFGKTGTQGDYRMYLNGSNVPDGTWVENASGTISEIQANGTSVATSGVANIPAASTSAYGVTKLTSSTTSTSTVLAATPYAVKLVKDAIPTKTSDLTNDSGFITSADVPDGSTASTTTPKMNGTAAVGTETAFARGDHVHPTDTSRAPTSHASTATTYGKGTSSNYGHVKLTDTVSSSYGSSDGYGVTPKGVYNAIAAAGGADGRLVTTGHNLCSSQSISASGYANSSTTISKTGYYPLGIVGWTSNSTYAVPVVLNITSQADGSATVNWYIRNVATSSVTVTFQCKILWYKTT